MKIEHEQILIAFIVVVFGALFLAIDYFRAGDWYWFKKESEKLGNQISIAIFVSGLLFLVYFLLNL